MDKRRSLINPLTDFWLLGGASILLFAVLFLGTELRDSSEAVQNRFYQLAIAFTLLTLICNHPHFMISYKFGYGRGWKFIFAHWFSLIFVPLGMIVAFGVAYLFFRTDISDAGFVTSFNSFVEHLGLRFQLGLGGSLGLEILALSVWLMYLTVGWHYSKQVYGCMMVYSHFDQYALAKLEKIAIRVSLFSMAAFQLIYMAKFLDAATKGDSYSSDPRFPGVKMSAIGLPDSVTVIAGVIVAVTSGICIFIFLRKFLKHGTKPSMNFLVPWVSFHFWWVFAALVPEFIVTIPFFHSLQYLPFAYRYEASTYKRESWIYTDISVRVIALLAIGFLAFEYVPNRMDKWLEVDQFKAPFFFLTAAVVFINVHHFFIDSVVWKMRDKKVRDVFS